MTNRNGNIAMFIEKDHLKAVGGAYDKRGFYIWKIESAMTKSLNIIKLISMYMWNNWEIVYTIQHTYSLKELQKQ